MITETIKTEIWEDIPEKPGYFRQVGMIKAEEVFEQVKGILKNQKFLDNLDYFHLDHDLYGKDFPYGRWIAAYPVIGDNEGHYIHVDIIAVKNWKTGVDIKEREIFIIAKTFSGFDSAAKLATEISRLFNDEKLAWADVRARYIIINNKNENK